MNSHTQPAERHDMTRLTLDALSADRYNPVRMRSLAIRSFLAALLSDGAKPVAALSVGLSISQEFN